MKKTAFFIVAITLSTQMYACWDPKGEFWNDWNEGLLISKNVGKVLVAPQAQDIKALIANPPIAYQEYLLNIVKQLVSGKLQFKP